MRYVKAQVVHKIAVEILRRTGSPVDEAETVAEHLVRANLLGHESHGVGMLPLYLEHIKEEYLVPGKPALKIMDEDAILVFDGQRGYGQRTAREAMDAAIEKCRVKGLALLALRNAHHIGRVGAYGEMAIQKGFISIHFVNVVARNVIAPFGGRDGRMGTNPICIAIPGTANSDPVLLDMATSKIAVGKARVALEAGKPVEENNLIDADGNPTTDPAVIFDNPTGAILPIGTYKGYGLALCCEILAGALCGGGSVRHRDEKAGGVMNNMLAIIIDPQRLGDIFWIQTEIDAIVAHVTGSPPVEPENPVLVAGDPERINFKTRTRQGIPFSRGAWEEIKAAAAAVKITDEEWKSMLEETNRDEMTDIHPLLDP